MRHRRDCKHFLAVRSAPGASGGGARVCWHDADMPVRARRRPAEESFRGPGDGGPGDSAASGPRNPGAPAAWHGPLAGAALTIAALAPCVRLLLGETFYFRDIFLHYLPQKELIASIVRAGHFPAWDPFLFSGSALWANPNDTAAHPATLLYLALGAPLAFGIDTALHLLLAAWGAALLARRLGCSAWGGLVAGASFALSGTMLSLVCLHPLLLSLAPLPALLCAWDDRLRGASSRSLALVVVLGAACGLGGGAEACAFVGLTVLCWTLVACRERRVARLGTLAACGALSVALAAPAVVPALAVIRASPRGAGLSWEMATSWSLHPGRLVEMLVPGILGDPTALADASWWGRALEGEREPYLVGIGLGPIVLVLAAIGALRGLPARRWRILLTSLLGASLLLALGRHAPGATWVELTGWLPPLRYPVKFLLLGALPLALLAGAGLDVLRRDAASRRPLTGALAATASLAALLGALAAACARAPHVLAPLVRAWLGEGAPSATRLAAPLAASAALALVAWLLLLLVSRRPAMSPLLALGAAGGLAWSGLALNPTSPAGRLAGTPPAASLVREVAGASRTYRESSSAHLEIPAPTDEASWYARYQLETLDLWTAARYGIPLMFHADPDGLAPERMAAVARAVPGLPWERRLALLRSAGVGVVVADTAAARDGLALAETFTVAGRPLSVLRLERPLQPVRFVPEALLRPTEASAFEAASDPGRDAERRIVIVGAGSAIAPAGCAGTIAPPAPAPSPSQDFVIDAGCDGFAFIAQAFQPGLEATLDGSRAAILPADVAFCAVRVPAGRHVLSWRYRVPGLAPALGASGAAALVVLALAVGPGRRRARRLAWHAGERGAE